MQKKLIVAPSPFLRNQKASTRSIMLDVIIAMLPTAFAAVWYFGAPALSVMITCVLGCVISEWAYQKMTHQTSTVGDLSAVVTGLLLAFNMPASAPWWMGLIGSVIAIVLVKQMFGGIGQNFINPALAARTILMLSWTVLMAANVMPQAGQIFGLDASVKAVTATPAAVVETVETEAAAEATAEATGEAAAPVEEAAPVAAEVTTEATAAATGKAATPAEEAAPVAAKATTETTAAATGEAATPAEEAAPVAAEATTEATAEATATTGEAATPAKEAAPIAAEATTEAAASATGETTVEETSSEATSAATTKATTEATASSTPAIEATASATPTTVEATSIATPLNADIQPGQYSLWDLFSGNIPGMLGETCKLTLLLGGLYLIFRHVIDWRIPLSFIATAFVLFWIHTGVIYSPESGSQNALYQLFSGGLILGAFFMATDYVTSPVSKWGRVMMGVGCAVVLYVIRFFNAGYPEGCSFAILFMNVLTPLIDRYTARKPFGYTKPPKTEGKGAAKV